MNKENLIKLAQEIVTQANEFKKTLINEEAPVNYACVFSQSNEEYDELIEAAKNMDGKVVQDTQTGPVFQIPPLPTVAGDLKLLKIRKPDQLRPECGDADFTLENYNQFKKESLDKPGFKLIEREKFEMIEAKSPDYNVLVYFSHPPLDDQLGIK
ncbi:hypothetical protein KKF32_04805 [Patescibacteria group bacterium]|nr:hypothetical protein [Patescibacteria group bacterium]